MRTPSALVRVALLLACGALPSCTSGGLPRPAGVPWQLASGSWRDDALWYDGQAEVAVYQAQRTIYGLTREYRATAYTNKETMDPATSVKSSNASGVEVFKHHWSERVPTENYDYDFSTSTYTRSADLSAARLTAATQEDCGASFKTVWPQAGGLSWFESVYFPGGGQATGSLPARTHFFDELSLLLRDFPFEDPLARAAGFELWLVPMQRDTHQVPFEPQPFRVRCTAREPRDLPIGRMDAYRLEVAPSAGGEVLARLWFAADGQAPLLHVLVEYEGPQGLRFQLETHARRAYWQR